MQLSLHMNKIFLPGPKKKRRNRRSYDIAEVVITGHECTKRIGVLSGPTKKRRYRRTVVIAETAVGENYCI